MVSGGECLLAGDVLGMEVGGGEEEVLAGCELLGEARGDGTVVRAEAGIDHHGGARADDDGDVGIALDGPHMLGDVDGRLVGGHLPLVRVSRGGLGGGRGDEEGCGGEREERSHQRLKIYSGCSGGGG